MSKCTSIVSAVRSKLPFRSKYALVVGALDYVGLINLDAFMSLWVPLMYNLAVVLVQIHELT